jgi:hypothetical protein
MPTALRYLFSALLIAHTLVPGWALEPASPHNELNTPTLVAAAPEAESPAVATKHVEWSFDAAPVLLHPEQRHCLRLQAIVSPPPHAVILPGLMLDTVRNSSDI